MGDHCFIPTRRVLPSFPVSFVRTTISWVPHPLRRSWFLVFQLRNKGWVRSQFDSHRPIASQSFRHDAEILATHPSLRSKKQKRSSAKSGAHTLWKLLSVKVGKPRPPAQNDYHWFLETESVNIEVVRNAVGSLDKLLSQAR